VARTVHFADEQDKAKWLGAAARFDSLHPAIQETAARFGRLPPPERAQAIHRFVRDSIAYTRDPGGREEFADAPTVLLRGHDDCDGKARLFVALCEAAGLPARILPWWGAGGHFDHVQAEVCVGGRWLLAELIVHGVELGEGPEKGSRDASGAFVMAGPQRPPTGTSRRPR
jgi:transglutaminase-like putative cysteine protease